MSVIAPRPFLTAGRPRYSADDFADYKETFPVWEVTLVLIKRWCSDMRLRYIRPAVAVLICGVADSKKPSLLYCSVLEECTAHSATTDLMDCLSKVPEYYRPKEIHLRYSAETMVLDLLKKDAPLDESIIGADAKSEIEDQMSRFCQLQVPLHTSLVPEGGDVVFTPVGGGRSGEETWAIGPEIQDMITWMHEERNMFPDISLKALPLATCPTLCERLVSLGQQYPFLSSQRLNAPKDAKTAEDGVNIVCTAFSTSGVVFPHVVVVQRPYVVPPPEDNQMAPRPQQPQPVGIEFHLHRYVGDAMFVKNTLTRPFNVETYEDMIHQDGEVYVQFGPVEGSAFSDVEFTQKLLKSTTEGWGTTVGVGSKYPHVAVPRVIFNKPGGKVVRKTPVDSPKMVIVGETVDEDMIVSAIAAIEYFCTKLYDGSGVGAPKDTYQIKWDIAVLDAPEATPLVCNFCGRRRDTMKRCGGCKVACYCCVDHQAQDWKGNHKKECKWLKVARDDYGSLLGIVNEDASLEMFYRDLEQEQNNVVNNPSAEVALDEQFALERAKSTVNTFQKLLVDCGVEIGIKGGRPTVVHLLNIENAELFLAELARSEKRYERQLRIVLIQSAVATGVQNDVLGLSPGATSFAKLPATGALGDIWHIQGQDETQFQVLARLYHDKYITLQTGSPLMQPDVVMSLGSTKYEGLTFFHSATTIIADSYLGKIPVAIAEPHYLTAHRTLGAILGRLEMSGVNPLRRQTKRQSLTWMCKQSDNIERSQCGIEVHSNKSCLSLSPVPPSLVVKQCQMESLPRIPLHVNAYYCLFMPVDSQQ